MAQDNHNTTFPNTLFLVAGDKELRQDITRVLSSEHQIAPTTAGDGAEAWAALSAGNFDYIIMDWKLDKLSAIALFNRLKQHRQYQTVPILVVSNLVQKENFSLVTDYPLTALSSGEFSPNSFSIKFSLLVREAAWFRDNNGSLDTIVPKFRTEPDAAQEELSKVFKSSPNPLPLMNLAARKFRELELFRNAEAVLVEARKLKDNPTTIMELAKVYHMTGRSAEAASLIMKQKFSVKNIEKLLLHGELNLANQNPGEARKMFGDVLAIDADNELGKKGVLVADNLIQFMSNSEGEQLPQSFASLLNLVAVSFVKAGKHEEGVEHYKAALAFLRDSIDQARLIYNLGLAYMKRSEKKEALHWFRQSEKLGGKVFTKATDQIKILLEEAAKAKTQPGPAATPTKKTA